MDLIDRSGFLCSFSRQLFPGPLSSPPSSGHLHSPTSAHNRPRTEPARRVGIAALTDVATCSDGDSFFVDAEWPYDHLEALGGCYGFSGLTEHDLPEYVIDGETVAVAPMAYASDLFGSQAIWVLAHALTSEGGEVRRIQCRDADEKDAGHIHPTEVTEWDCIDDFGGYTRLDGLTASCGCPTTGALTILEPTPPPTPEPVAPVTPSTRQLAVSCGETESFRITSGAFPEVDGCYQISDESFSGGGSFEVWSVSGTTRYNQIVVAGLADDGTGEVDDSVYLLVFFSDIEDSSITYCMSFEDAITVHPTEATWNCDLDGSGSFAPVSDEDIFFRCGCETPAPAAITPAPVPVTPVPVTPVLVTPVPVTPAQDAGWPPMATTPATPAPLAPDRAFPTISPVSASTASTTNEEGDDGLPVAATIGIFVVCAIVAVLGAYGAFKLICHVCYDNNNNHVYCCTSNVNTVGGPVRTY